jgi:hypothetical protein
MDASKCCQKWSCLNHPLIQVVNLAILKAQNYHIVDSYIVDELLRHLYLDVLRLHHIVDQCY